MKFYSRKDISDELGVNISTAKKRIDSLGMKHVKKEAQNLLYSKKQFDIICEKKQIEIIKVTQTFHIFESKMNYANETSF